MTLLLHSLLLLAVVVVGCGFVKLWRTIGDDEWDSY